MQESCKVETTLDSSMGNARVHPISAYSGKSWNYTEAQIVKNQERWEQTQASLSKGKKAPGALRHTRGPKKEVSHEGENLTSCLA